MQLVPAVVWGGETILELPLDNNHVLWTQPWSVTDTAKQETRERRALSGRTEIAKQQLQAKTEVPLKTSSSLPCFTSPRSLVLSRAKQAKLPFRAHLRQELWAPSQSKETATVLVCQLPTFCSNKWHTHSLVQYYVQPKKNKRPGEHHPRPA